MICFLRFLLSILVIITPFTLAQADGNPTKLTTVSQSRECGDMNIDASNFVISVNMPKSAYTPNMPTINHIEGFRLIEPTRLNLQFSGSGLNNLCSYYLMTSLDNLPEIAIKGETFSMKWLSFSAVEDSALSKCRSKVKADMEIVASNYVTGDPVCVVDLASSSN